MPHLQQVERQTDAEAIVRFCQVAPGAGWHGGCFA